MLAHYRIQITSVYLTGPVPPLCISDQIAERKSRLEESLG